MITGRASAVHLYVNPPLLRFVFKHGLPHGRAADVAKTYDQDRQSHEVKIKIS